MTPKEEFSAKATAVLGLCFFACLIVGLILRRA